ncbi:MULTISPECIES: RHS repeat-associated core domain-containing protein [Lysobacter]|uniref:RHS repeat-associated core domain-containing protein n=1 Tax=Lysobacter TaxID=68 RepID=UPI001F304E53|nr:MULTISPECIES: RHS repeat-associated core domain-containing protein [Lysobacter]UJB18449.1 DUF6531 domain-containing protein [Lysobacter capsici]UJQ27827.1 DUF6531 domain-containing protein [Lysobacter gummosus]
MKGAAWSVKAGALVALLWVGSAHGQATEYVYSATRYMPSAESRDFKTLAEAEAFIRTEPATPIGNAFLRKTRSLAKVHSEVLLEYAVPRRIYESYQGGYYDGHATGNQTDCYYLKCRSEEEMVAASMRAYPLSGDYTPVVRGAYLSPPFAKWSSNGRSALVNLNDYRGVPAPNERHIVATSAGGHSYSYAIQRVDEYQCPQLFEASHNDFGDPGLGVWPLVCNNSAHGQIRAWLKQRAPYTPPSSCSGAAGKATAPAVGDRIGNPCAADYGNKEYREDDFSWDSFDFRRAYNSIADFPLSSGLGDNWSHSFSDRLTFDSQGYATFWTRPDGYVERFYEVVPGQGTYLSHTTPNLALSKPTKTPLDPKDGVWKLRRPGQSAVWFNAGGFLVRKQTANSSVDFAYCGGNELGTDECPSSDLIRRATNSRGRVLEFSYTVLPGAEQQPRLVRIKSEGRVLMEYQHDSQGRLTAAWHDGVVGSGRRYLYGESALLCRNAAGVVIAGCTTAYYPNHLTGIEDESGVRLATYSYDDKGRVTTSEHAGGTGRVTLDYISANQTRTTLPSGAVKTFTYNSAEFKRLLGSTTTGGSDTVGQTVARDYEGRWRIAYDSVAGGARTNYSYIGLNLASRTEGLSATGATTPLTRTIQTDWIAGYNEPGESRTLDSTGALVSKSKWTYNDRGQPVIATTVDPLSGAERLSTMTYCEQVDIDAGRCPIIGQALAVDGPRTDVADITRYTYYPSDAAGCMAIPASCDYRKGDLWKVTDALGRSVEMLRYDFAGRVLSARDGNAVVTDSEYSTRGWLLASKVHGANNNSEADDRITRIEYWPTGQIKKSTLPDGTSIAYAYDAAQRLTDITDNAGNRIHYTLDNEGNRIKEDTRTSAGALKRTLSRVYNTLGQLRANQDASQNATIYRYDGRGNQDRTTDALGRLTDQSYDPLNRLVKTLQDVGGLNVETKYEYDALDRLTKVTDPKGLDTVYAYNGFGDQTRLTSPDTGITNYTYNAAGKVATKQDANDPEPHRYTYDALNRPKTVSYTAAGGPGVEYDYDTVNSVCTAGETFAIGRVTAMRTDGTELKYCYDRFGQVVRKVQTVDSKSLTLRYAYTLGGQLSAMTYPDGAVAHYVRDSQGRIKEVDVTPAGGVRMVLLSGSSYEPFGPVAGWTYGNGRTLARTYDQDYRAKSIYDPSSGGLSLHYGYNSVGELTELKDGLQSATLAKYDYDSLGRVTTTRDGPTGTPLETYGYDGTGNRISLLSSGVTDTYVYPVDSHRLTNVAGVARGYDIVGNTTSIGGIAKEFVYNSNGRMTQVKQGGVVKAVYRYNARGERVASTTSIGSAYTLYDEAGNWVGNYDTNGRPEQQATWIDAAPVGVLSGAGAAQKVRYIESDHLGTPRNVIDPDRNVVIWSWDAKGEIFGNSTPNQDPDIDGAGFVFDSRFAGQQFDSASGLVYNYFRDYDPSSGRYIQSDPIGLRGGIGTYPYVASSPLLFNDPTGENPLAAGACLIPGVGWGACAVIGVGALAVGGCYLTGVCQRAGEAAGDWLGAQSGNWSASSTEGGLAVGPAPHSHDDEDDALGYFPDPFGGDEVCKELEYWIKILRAQIAWRKTDLNIDSRSYAGHLARITILENKLTKLEASYRGICGKNCPV